jgi:hypothetical protein
MDELRAIAGIGCVYTGQGRGECVWIMPVGHRCRIVAAVGQQLGVCLDALGDVLIDAERRRGIDHLAVDDLLCRLLVAPRGTGALDPEQVVVVGSKNALAPAGLVDGLRDGHRSRHPVLELGGHGPPRDLHDEGMLGPGVR